MNDKIKLILVGNSKVGKTSIITQYIEKNLTENYIPTYAHDKSLKTIKLKNNKEYKLEIWDTIGQEKYRAANNIFMKNTQIALLVYDIINKKSFDDLNEWWYKQICDINGKDIIIGVVGNKNDLYEERVIEENEGQKYAKEIQASFFETSAFDYNSIFNLFEDIVSIYDQKFHSQNENNFENKDNEKSSKKNEESFQIKKKKKKKNEKKKKNFVD